MKVFDLFPFFNESPLLELRLSELDPVVDVFGLVELPVTFTDKPKPLYYSESGRNDPKVRATVPSAYPSGPHPTVDWFQRSSLWVNAYDAEPDDIIMLSDVDEIPDREVVRDIIASKFDYPVTLKMKLFYHRVDLMDEHRWLGTIIAPRHCLGKEPNLQDFREHRSTFPQVDGGWHFSWLGDAAAIATKLSAVDILRENAIYGAAGIEPPDEDPAFLHSCYETGVDLFGRKDRPKSRVPIIPGVNQPHEIAAWLKKYPQYAAADTVPY